jgi:hypothetical protein
MGFLQAGFTPQTNPAHTRAIYAARALHQLTNQSERRDVLSPTRAPKPARTSSWDPSPESAGPCSAARPSSASAQSMQRFVPMDKDPSVDVIVKRTEIGRGKRVAILVAVVFATVGLIGVVAAGFRGRHIPRRWRHLFRRPPRPGGGHGGCSDRTPVEKKRRRKLRQWFRRILYGRSGRNR